MSDQIDASAAEKQALEILFELTKEATEGGEGLRRQVIPAEIRLAAAKELLHYAERKSVPGATALPQPGRRRHRDE